jgi:hypothetical protein
MESPSVVGRPCSLRLLPLESAAGRPWSLRRASRRPFFRDRALARWRRAALQWLGGQCLPDRGRCIVRGAVQPGEDAGPAVRSPWSLKCASYRSVLSL